MKLQDIVELSHRQALSHGWWDPQGCGCCGTEEVRTDQETIALMSSEVVGEFVEAERKRESPVHYDESRALDAQGRSKADPAFDATTAMPKPDGPAVELVDLVIRLGDFFGHKGWNLAQGNGETTEELAFDDGMDLSAMATDLHLNKPLEFAQIVGNQIALGSMALLRCDEGVAREELGTVMNIVIWYFQYRGWNFEKVFKEKFRYNERRPIRHGGKAY